MRFSGVAVVVYALLVALGGLMGYLKAGSLVSLYMGLSFGLLLATSGILLCLRRPLGYYGALVLSITLGLFFSYRYANSQAWMPAGMMVVLSFGMTLLLLISRKRKEARTRST